MRFKFSERYSDFRYGPKLAERYIQNEDDSIELSYIFLEDVPEEYREEFSDWVYRRKLDLIVERKTFKQREILVEYEEKVAVNVIYWEKWYNRKINKV